jgi:hypothetical protein
LIEHRESRQTVTHRELFFSILEGKKPAVVPFMPDISDWYVAGRSEPGKPRRFGCAQFIPDNSPFHKIAPRNCPDKYKNFTMMDFYREFDWGYPVHIGDWYDAQYDGGVTCETTVEGNRRITTIRAPLGELRSVSQMASDGSWAPVEHLAKELRDLEIVKQVVAATRYVPRYDRVERVMTAMGEQGLGDMVLWRCPFGKLVQSYLGFEKVIYGLADDAPYLEDFMQFQEAKDLELVALAARGPERLVIISDHADENLIAPPHYKRYCIPFYRKACEILHAGGKFVSTHLDGNFHSFFPFIGETGFDLLDGCTPAPMFNYTVEQLAEALPEGMYAYCGVPSTLFCQHRPDAELTAFADRIVDSFRGRGVINVGDILPPDGDVEQVIAVGKHVAERNAGA